MRERYRKFYDRIISIYQERSIQLLLTISFSVVTILGMALLGGAAGLMVLRRRKEDAEN